MITRTLAGGVFAAALTLVAGLTGCSSNANTTTANAGTGATTRTSVGGSTDTTTGGKLAKAELIQKGDDICVGYLRQIGDLGATTDEAALKEQLQRTYDLETYELAELRQLALQGDGDLKQIVDLLSKVVGDFRGKIGEIAANPRVLEDTNDPFVQEVEELSRRAKEYGFTKCGQGSSSSGSDGGSTATTGARRPSASTTSTTGDDSSGSGSDTSTTTGGSAAGKLGADDCKAIDAAFTDIIVPVSRSDAQAGFDKVKGYNPPAEVVEAVQRILDAKLEGRGGAPDDVAAYTAWHSSVCSST